MAKLSESDDTKLIRQAVGGSKEAFETLVRQHELAVRVYLTPLLRDAATVDDVAQEVFLSAYQHLSDFRSIGTIRSWLLGMAKNMAKQHIRSTIRRRERETGPLATQMAKWKLERLETHAQTTSDQEEVLAQLRHCLERLSPESRNVVEQHYFCRTTIKSIAARQQRSAGSVRMMLLRVRRTLSQCLAEKLSNRT